MSREEAARGFDTMMSGEATPSQMGGLLMALRVRGETVDEITGAVTAMREKMLRVRAAADAIDVVRTGGDASGSVNISTCAAVIVVDGSDGLDEITTAGTTDVAALENGAVRTFEITPEEMGLQRVKSEALRGGEAKENAQALVDVLKGKQGAFRDVAGLNAAAALVVAARPKDLKQALAPAQTSIDSGEAASRLQQLVAISNA